MTTVVLGGIGVAAAILLYVVSRLFRVEEDPRIDQVEAELPGANCGACGYSGCRDFAVNCVKRMSLEGMHCPGAGNEGMSRIASILGVCAESVEAKVAVVRCGATCESTPRKRRYEGVMSCTFANSLGTGPTDCSYGCLGEGDCAAACRWGAITADPDGGPARVDTSLCTGCGECVKACPRGIIALMPKDGRVWVNCMSHDRGAVARKICSVTCIACGKCARTCESGAISVSDNLASIDNDKCIRCGKCADVCPDHTIMQARD